jgi:HK97 family phage major capsid protein
LNRFEEIRQNLNQIVDRKFEIRKMLNDDNSDLDKLRVELDDLNQREERLVRERRSIEANYINNGGGSTIETFGSMNPVSEQQQRENEQRAASFADGKAVKFDMNEISIRSISIAGGNVALARQASSTLQPVFNEVSNLVDLVHSFPLQGGESYNQGFIVTNGSADYSAEGADYHDNAEVKTDFVNIVKSKITTYFELPEEVQKLGGDQYLSFASEAALNAVRKKMAQQILVGTGGTNGFVGIFNAPANVMPVAQVDKTISVIDSQTLDDIVFGYGGDESVEGGAYLILNKQTLADFSKIRSTTGERLYTIKLDKNGNSGTISSEDAFEVPFIINSVVKSFEAAISGEFFMAYGKPSGYEMPLFSGLEVQESRDYKFKSGQIAIRASVFAGGNVCCYKGFTRFKKA